MAHIQLHRLDEFLAAVKEAKLEAVVLRVVSEVRPRVEAGHRVEVAMQRWAELLAYDKGTILSVRLDGADGDTLEEALEVEGLRVRRVSGNIT